MKEFIPLLGAHTSIAGGVHTSFHRAHEIGANIMQIFTANQRQWIMKDIDEEEVQRFFEHKEKFQIHHIMSHGSYLVNLGSPKKEALQKSIEAFEWEIRRCNQLKLDFLNFHPGSSLDSPKEQCLDTIVDSLLKMQPLLEHSNLKLLIETTAGQGSNMGSTFYEVGYLTQRLEHKIPIGVCIDTCHIFAAGYDIRTKKNIDDILIDFDQEIGLDKLMAMHLNDSKYEIGLKKDRHEQLGDGKIGLDAFKIFMNHPKTKHLPKYLETPGGPTFWKPEITLLKEAIQ